MTDSEGFEPSDDVDRASHDFQSHPAAEAIMRR
jgi:hypothetical protein